HAEALEPLQVMKLVLELFALQELADLAADQLHHANQIRLRLARLAAEEFHHSGYFAPARQRESHAAVQAVRPRNRPPWTLLLDPELGKPDRLSRGPDCPRQSFAAAERELAASVRELAGCSPCLDAPDAIVLGVHGPQRSNRPLERFGDRAEHARGDLRQVR